MNEQSTDRITCEYCRFEGDERIEFCPRVTRIILIDPHAMLRSGLKLVLESGHDFCVISEAKSIEEAIGPIALSQPELVMMDLHADERLSIHIMDDIIAASPNTRILVLTDDSDTEVQQLAVLAGAHGVLTTNETDETLRKAIAKVAAGEAWIDRRLTSKLLSSVRGHEIKAIDEQRKIDRLTPRELEITKLIASGLVNKEVGNRLNISEKTVRNHLTVIYSKLNVASRLELALYASHNGIS